MANTHHYNALARAYMGGLAHVHTRLSNYRGHFESDQSVTALVGTLRKADAPGVPLRYIMINQHTSNPTHPRPLGKFSLRARALLRKRWLTHIQGVPIYYGFEASILKDGSTDLTPLLAANCEMVIASRHKLPQAYTTNAGIITAQFLAACRNRQIDVIGHPLRYIENVHLDWPKIFHAAASSGTAIELNLNSFPEADAEPERYGKWREWVKLLGASKCQAFIGSDLHNKLQVRGFLTDWQALDNAHRPNRLRDFLKTLQAAELGPERIVNANQADFAAWLALDKNERSL